MYTISTVARLSNHFVIADDGCWNWIGAKSNGYGIAEVAYKLSTAHRHLYQAIFGLLPKKIQLDHLCRNRACVNPKHLEPVTQKVNILRGISPSAKNKVKTHCINGHEFTASNTHLINRRGGLERVCRSCRKDAVRKSLLRKETSYGKDQRT